MSSVKKQQQTNGSVTSVANAINKACRSSGGKYAQYSCKYVSWDDAARGTVGGGLSCWGANITDTYLKGKDGQRFFTVRSDNWNEKLGCVSSDKIAVVVGNHVAGGGGDLKPITLRSLLKNFGTYGNYCSVPEGTDLSSEALDDKVSIRFQTTFLPVAGEDKATVEFYTEAYNYNTRSDQDPRNMVVLGTTQGIAIQQDGAGTKRLLHHAVDKDGVAHQYYLEAEKSSHSVGGEQKETEEERQDAMARGKATAAVIGVPAMGTRFNALLTVQIPLKQRRYKIRYLGEESVDVMACCFSAGPPPPPTLCMMPMIQDDTAEQFESASLTYDCWVKPSSSSTARARRGCGRGGRGGRGPRVGVSNAARVSRGSNAGRCQGLKTLSFERDPAQHMTVTIVLYNTVAGGVPSVEDVKAAIEDMENLYKECAWSGRLADEGFDFMKDELTVKDAMDIQKKVVQQPYVPTSQPVANYNVFPTD